MESWRRRYIYNRVVLAPMVSICSVTFKLVVKEFSVGLLCAVPK